MKRCSSLCALLLLIAGAGALMCSCGRDKSKAPASEKTPVAPVVVEIRQDGLAYLPGADKPFTGEAVTPYPDAPGKIKTREPYTEGRLDGDKVELFRDGTTKTLRRYEKGVPRYAASYYKNGQMKFELGLNAKDKGEGPYKRWYPDGTLESTATFDSEERWHDEVKEWDPAGKLKSHFIFKHGKLQKIIFESEESRKARQAAGIELEEAPGAQGSDP